MRRQETPRAARSVGVRSWVAPVLAQRGTIFSVNAAYPLFFPRPVSSSLVIARYSRPTLSQQAWFTLLVGIGRNVGGSSSGTRRPGKDIAVGRDHRRIFDEFVAQGDRRHRAKGARRGIDCEYRQDT